MTTPLEPLRLFDFLCEHTRSKSRVMALVGTFDSPRSLAAVLTCKDKEHAHQAQLLLRRTLAARDVAQVAQSIEILSAELPDAPASSLRRAVTHAATGTWPRVEGTLYIPSADDDLEVDDEDPSDHAAPVTPHDARLRDLPGKVVRIATLREFHITDEDALICEAMAEGWEPIPASERDDDDPRDLVGAVMTLSDQAGRITGADTRQDQSEAGLLRPEEGDELTDWSKHPIRARFTYGYRLREQPAPDPERPHKEARLDLVSLFPVKECGCEEEDCEDCAWQLTPRSADILLTALSVLADQAYDDAEELGDHPVTDHQPGNWEVFTRLPALTFKAKRRWRRRMARAFDDLAQDLKQGQWPQPSCTAEEMALHLAIEDAPMHLEDLDDEHRHNQLPGYADDYDWGMCSELFFQDHDVLMLFDARLDGVEHPDGDVNQHLGIGDLRAPAWFEPFGYPPARDPERGFRR